MQLNELGEDGLDVIQGEGALGMPRQLDTLPRRQVGKDPLPFLLDLLFDLADLLIEVDPQRMGVTVPLQFLQLPLEFNDGLLEIEIMFHVRARSAALATTWSLGLSFGPRNDELGPKKRASLHWLLVTRSWTPSPRRSEE
jgi:hypothetical protein